MFKRNYLFICDEEQAKKIGTWFMMVGVKVVEMKEVIIEEKLRWMFKVKMTLIERLMYKIDFEKGV